MECVSMSHV